jgi:hypothetical protein
MARFNPAVDQTLAWSAACAAYRINSGYVKWAETTSQRSNKEIVKELLQNPQS